MFTPGVARSCRTSSPLQKTDYGHAAYRRVYLVRSKGFHVSDYSALRWSAAALLNYWNYWLSVKYVFLAGRFSKAREFAIFMATTGVGLGLYQLTMWVLVGIAGINYLLAKCASLAIVTCWNFLSKKRIVFLD